MTHAAEALEAIERQRPNLMISEVDLPDGSGLELCAWLRANPGKASAGTQGAGGSSHIGGVFFQNATGTHFQFLPYRGGAPAILDLVAGQIDLMVAAPGDGFANQLLRAPVAVHFGGVDVRQTEIDSGAQRLH